MTGHTQFTIAINPANKGIKLRRRMDYSVLNQKAEVFVNGTLVGTWYDAGENTTLSWRDSDFEIPAAYTQGQSSLNIGIVFDNTGGTAWTEYDYWAYSYLDIDYTPPTTTSSPGVGSSNFPLPVARNALPDLLYQFLSSKLVQKRPGTANQYSMVGQ
jgi:hypothetical protein